MTRAIRCMAFVLALTLAVSVNSVFALPMTISKSTVEIRPANTCTSEQFVFIGTYHLAQRLDLPNEVIHVSISGARAISDNGTAYVLPYVDQLVVNVLPGFESTSVVNYSLISKGAAPNYRLQIIDRITVNANGDIAVLFQNATISC